MDNDELRGERIVLRRHRLEDFADSVALWSDPGVTRHIGGRPQTAEEVWARLLRYAGHWALLGYGYWVARATADGRFLGEVGFADFHREIVPSFEGVPELGWALIPASQGQGLASEAARMALAWADARWSRTVCMIAPDNAPSLRVAARIGFTETARTSYRDQPALVFTRTRS